MIECPETNKLKFESCLNIRGLFMKYFSLIGMLLLIFFRDAFAGQDRIIARVNDDVITLSELEERMKPIINKYEKSYEEEEFLQNLAKAEDYWINQLIENKLILQEAQRKNITATKEEIDERYEKIKQDFDSELQFKIFLESQGMNIDQLKKTISENIMIGKATAHIRERARFKISPVDITKYYNEHGDKFREDPLVRASHILIRFTGNEENDYKKAKDILSRIKNGEDFAALARQYSDDPHAQQGGDLGFFSRGQHIKEIDKAAFSLPVGQISDIIKSKLGYHIILVKQKKKERVRPLSEVQEEIQNVILKDKASKLWDEWIQGLKKKSYIEIYNKS